MNAAAQRIVALFAVLVLLAGPCCCGAALAAESVKRDHDCCSSGKASTSHKPACECSGQIVAETQSPGASPAAWFITPPSFHRDLPEVVLRADPRLLSVSRPSGCSPPPHERRRLLSVWLI